MTVSTRAPITRIRDVVFGVSVVVSDIVWRLVAPMRRGACCIL